MARLVDLRILSTSPLFDEAVGTESLGCLPHPPYRQGAVEKRIRVHLVVAVQHEEEYSSGESGEEERRRYSHSVA